MRKLLSVISVAAAVWFAPLRASAAPPLPPAPVTVLTPNGTTEVNAWNLVVSGTWELQGASNTQVELRWGDHACSLAAQPNKIEHESDCAALLDSNGPSQATLSWNGGQMNVNFERRTLRNCVEYRSKTEKAEPSPPTSCITGPVTYWMQEERDWTGHEGDNQAVPSPVAAALPADADLLVLAELNGALVRVGTKSSDNADPQNEDALKITEQALLEANVLKECEGLLESVQPRQEQNPDKDEEKPLTDKEKRKLRNKAVRKDWGYVICVDATKPNAIRTVRATTVENADPLFLEGEDHMFEGRHLDVHVWYDGKKNAVGVDLSGNEGRINTTYVAEGLHEGPGSDLAHSKYSFAGRATDQVARLSITVHPAGDKSKPLGIEQQLFKITAVYLRALRFGLSALVAPFERDYTARIALDAANNPGRVIAVDGGADSPLFRTELVTTYSVFFTPVYQNSFNVTGGAVFGVGVLAASSDGGWSALTSVHAGLEIDFGRDWALAATVALRRTNVLKDGYFVGRSIADSESYTRVGVRPAFGLMLTWSPDFTKAIGKARKAF